MSKKFTSKSELSKAKNFGAAHEGTHHWVVQRATAIANIPLVVWFVYSVVSMVGRDVETVQSFFQSPLNAVLMALLVFSSFYHAALGLQTVIEDYVHCKCKKVAALFVVKGGLLALGTFSVLAIVKLHLG